MGLLDSIEIEKKIPELSDEVLLAESLKRPQIFAELFRRYEKAFLRKAETVMKTKEGAEDVVAEVFTKIYAKGNSFVSQGEGSFKSWGYRILMNTAFTHYQKMRRGGLVEFSEEFEEVFPDMAQLGEQEQKVLADYVASVFVRMPDSFSSILKKFFIEGKTQEEIANEEGLSVGAVKTRVYRAKEAFRESMENVG